MGRNIGHTENGYQALQEGDNNYGGNDNLNAGYASDRSGDEDMEEEDEDWGNNKGEDDDKLNKHENDEEEEDDDEGNKTKNNGDGDRIHRHQVFTEDNIGCTRSCTENQTHNSLLVLNLDR